MAIEAFQGGLTIPRGLGDGSQHRWLDVAEIDMGDPLCHADVRIVRRTRMSRDSLGFNRTFNGLVLSVDSLMKLDSLVGAGTQTQWI